MHYKRCLAPKRFIYGRTVVPIFVEHWGGDNLQFYPNFAPFSTLGGMNLDHDFVQVWKFSEDQKKMPIEHFFSPNLGEDQKKVFSKNRTLVSPNLRSDVHPFKLLGGIQPNYWGEYIPPGFRHPFNPYIPPSL